MVRVGLLGCGIVGSAVARLLHARKEELTLALGGEPIEVVGVAVRNPWKKRDVPIPPHLFTTDALSLVRREDVEVVVELIGGIEPARTLILAALKEGKPVVTANKELLSTLGREILDEAEAKGVDFFFEAAVGGGIPLIRPLKEHLAGERVRRVVGIVNGTTNYILTRMSEEGLSFSEALAEAERLGYTERDPTADVEGFDAAAKAAILASIAFNARVVAGDVYREGITGITPDDIAFARRLGYAVKLLAIAEETDGGISARVHPAMVPLSHPLAAVSGSYNAVFVQGESVGNLMFYGRGAGGEPTAISVLGDLVQAARNLRLGGRGMGCTCYYEKRVLPSREMDSQFYLLLQVVDRPGVLAKIAGAFGENQVSIKSVWQEGTGERARLVLVTHRAREGAFQATLEALRGLDVVLKVESVMRVEGEE